MNKIDLAEALIAIADSGSIHQAANKLHQTSAAISKKLSKLEDYLQVQLVVRGRKGLTLTDLGQRYYHQAKLALEQFKLAEVSITNSAKRIHGELKIATNYHYASSFIVPKLHLFLQKYPGIKINLQVTEGLVNFNLKKIDVAIGLSNQGAGNLLKKQIDTIHYCLCASPAYLKLRGTPKTPAELLQHDFIAHSDRKPEGLIILDEDEKIIVEPKMLVNNSQLRIAAALSHLGFIWTPDILVKDYVKKNKLNLILKKYTQHATAVYIFYDEHRYEDATIQAFIDFF